MLADVYSRRRQCRPNWFRDRSVSVPPYLRPIEEEPDSEDHQLDSLSVDRCCEDSNNCRAAMSSAGARDVIIPSPVSERLQRDVTTNGRRAFDTDGTRTCDVTESPSRDCRRPISDCQCQCMYDDGGSCTTDDNFVTHSDVIGESSSRDSRSPINGDTGDTRRTDGNNFPPDDVTRESRSRERWRRSYVIMASLMACIACLTALSPSCVIFVVIVTSLITHHLISS